MLDALRRGATTWVAKILLGLLIASFAVWGVADVFRLGGGTTIAEVGDTEIEATAFQRATPVSSRRCRARWASRSTATSRWRSACRSRC
jgi:SurA N-terminal domain